MVSRGFFEERCVFPVWVYIILKRSGGSSLAHAHSAWREATLGSCSIVPGARVASFTRAPEYFRADTRETGNLIQQEIVHCTGTPGNRGSHRAHT